MEGLTLLRTRDQLPLPAPDREITAVYAFSADPITWGHVNIVERAARTFHRVVVGIGRNPTKRYLLPREVRLALARDALAHLPNVEVTAFQGLVVDFAARQGARVIVRGVRNSADFDYEQLHHLVGLSQQAGMDTHILFADPTLAHISSSVAKAVQEAQGFTQDYLPPAAKAALEAQLSGQLIVGVSGAMGAGKSHLCQELVANARALGAVAHHVDLDHLAAGLLAGPAPDEANPDDADPDDDPSGGVAGAALRAALVARLGTAVQLPPPNPRGLLSWRALVDHLVAPAKEAKGAEGAEAGTPSRQRVHHFLQLLAVPLLQRLRQVLLGRRGLILLESALLAEAGLLPLCNGRVVLVDAPDALRHERLRVRALRPTADPYPISAEARLATRLSLATTGQGSLRSKARAIAAFQASTGFGHTWRWRGEPDQGLGFDRLHPLLADILQTTGTVLDHQGASLALANPPRQAH